MVTMTMTMTMMTMTMTMAIVTTTMTTMHCKQFNIHVMYVAKLIRSQSHQWQVYLEILLGKSWRHQQQTSSSWVVTLCTANINQNTACHVCFTLPTSEHLLPGVEVCVSSSAVASVMAVYITLYSALSSITLLIQLHSSYSAFESYTWNCFIKCSQISFVPHLCCVADKRMLTTAMETLMTHSSKLKG